MWKRGIAFMRQKDRLAALKKWATIVGCVGVLLGAAASLASIHFAPRDEIEKRDENIFSRGDFACQSRYDKVIIRLDYLCEQQEKTYALLMRILPSPQNTVKGVANGSSGSRIP